MAEVQPPGEEVLCAEVALPHEGERRSLRLRGTVGIMCAPELRQAASALAAGDGDVHVDLSAVDHLDCAAAQVLLALKQALAAQARPLEVAGLGEAPARYLELAGVSSLLAPST